MCLVVLKVLQIQPLKGIEQCHIEQDRRDAEATGIEPQEQIIDDDDDQIAQTINQKENVEPTFRKDVLAAEKLPLPMNRFGFYLLSLKSFSVLSIVIISRKIQILLNQIPITFYESV